MPASQMLENFCVAAERQEHRQHLENIVLEILECQPIKTSQMLENFCAAAKKAGLGQLMK